ncbi:Crp/Fnr family transcriptional regulator [Parapedobacter deserti]|uniref:Crp/Fnr family transcriptional regulator n=1 Tax=Parapedobacter deserti TaxID=1912957 RepID=A0ABV7JLR9_9SPHI
MLNLKMALSFGGTLNQEEVITVCAAFKEYRFKPGEQFLSIGTISRKIGFLDSGILRAYIVDTKLNEVTTYFIRENQFAVEIKSFYDNEPSHLAFEAVTDCCVFAIDRMEWVRLSERVPKLYILTKSLTEAALLNKIKDNEFLHFGAAKDKYLFFLENYPELALRVPMQYIASYLKITPQSLSRIRKGLGEQQKATND